MVMEKKGAERLSFEERRRHLAAMSDEDLFNYFWDLADKITDPLIEAGRQYTTPSIERSVLLRMGFSSIEAGEIVKRVIECGLMPHGAGHVVWKLSEDLDMPLRDAGLAFARGEYVERAIALFGQVES